MTEPYTARAFLFDPGDAGAGPEQRTICEGSEMECLRAVWALPVDQRGKRTP